MLESYRPSGCSTGHASATAYVCGAVGDLAAHLNQRGGIQQANHLVDRHQLPLGQRVAAMSGTTFSAGARTLLSGAYSEDEAPNTKNGADKRTVTRLDAARRFIWTSVLCETIGAVGDFAAFQVAVEQRAVHHGEFAAEAAQRTPAN